MLRDLSSLIALLGYSIALTGFIPLFNHLPLLPRVLFFSGLTIGIINQRRTAPLLPPWLLTTVSILFFIWYGSQFSRHNPALPVVNILVILLATRLAAEKNPRTWLQTCAIALFALSSSSLFDLGPGFLFLLTLMIPMLALMLVLLTFQSKGPAVHLESKGLRQAIAAGLLIPLCALLLTPLFFPILPRTQLPFWSFIQQSGGSHKGLADTVSPGDSSVVPDSGALAFRAEMQPVAPTDLYWRGAVFSRIENQSWQKDSGVQSARPDIVGKTINQTITMEPGGSRTLVGLDLPVSFKYPGGSSIPNATWNRPLPSSRRFRYDVYSVSGEIGNRLSPPSRSLLTTIPDDISPKIRQLAEQFKQQGKTDRQRLDAAENWFRNNNFRYSRTDLPTGPGALEQFLFEKKSGHCEFFASTFALLLRGADLPSRLVGGYLGGIYNELGEYYRITEDRAHVWVEVWLEKEGWQRIDPSVFAVNAETALGERRQATAAQKLRLLLDSLDHTWNSAVITYDFERQLEIASKTSSHLQSFRLMDTGKKTGAALLMATIAVISSLLLLRLNRAGKFSSEARILKKFQQQTAKEFGITSASNTGLFDLARTTGSRQVRKFADIYAGAVYRGRKLNNEELKQLKDILRQGVRDKTITTD